MPTSIILEVLPAGFGHCLLIAGPSGRRTLRLLVDTGPDETYPSLKARQAQLRANRQGKRHVDMFVVTHIDHDHIGGASLLLNETTRTLIARGCPTGPLGQELAKSGPRPKQEPARDHADGAL